MQVTKTILEGVVALEPKVFGDARGYFLETWHRDRYAELGVASDFVQDNLSRSQRGILRGLHLQNPHAQGKLVQVFEGEVFDVAADVRVGSPTFGRWIGQFLSGANKRQLWIPEGFAHGFCVLSEHALLGYKCTEVYHPETELTIAWNDRSLNIQWPLDKPLLSAKDEAGLQLADIPQDRLPRYRARG
ncbi:MAG TPA: dTDP-4-dehydrorhamnose 3,5-epimerase [Polyangiales bacterium]|nr:dTDP-4-dehydrorhamnose 3,5-epimerase [Polyangiales bacterium]